MNRAQRRAARAPHAPPGDGWWFVGFRERAPGTVEITSIGPVARRHVPEVLEHVFMVGGFDGAYEWDGQPDLTEVQRVVASGAGIASLPGAQRLLIHPKHSGKLPAGADRGTAAYIALTLGITRQEPT